MTDLPACIISILHHFSSIFSRPVFVHIQTLFTANLLSKGNHTIADLLRTSFLGKIKNFSKYYNVFRRASWSPLKGSYYLFSRLVPFSPNKEIQLVIDSTIERRRGPKIKALGRKRDPVASSKGNKVLCIGQEWLVVSLLTRFSWAKQILACPFLSILMPPAKPLRSSRNTKDIERQRHKKMTKWACQAFFLIRRWLGKTQKCSIIADGAFACLVVAHACRKLNLGFISRLRLDARVFDLPPPPTKKRGRPLKAGKRIHFTELSKDISQNWTSIEVNWYGGLRKKIEYLTGENLWYNFSHEPITIRWVLLRDPEKEGDPVALLSTDLSHSPLWIIESFVSRWKLEVTFEEVRRHLGYETSRHWSDKAVDRITPCILASFSLVCLCGFELEKTNKIRPQTTSWYKKEHVTFSDILCHVRSEILRSRFNSWSSTDTTLQKKALDDLFNWIAAA